MLRRDILELTSNLVKGEVKFRNVNLTKKPDGATNLQLHRSIRLVGA